MVQALLSSHGVAARTRGGAQVAFSLHFVKPGTVSRASAKLLSELQAVRERAAYQVDLSFDADDVRRHLQAAAPLIEELATVVAAIPGLAADQVRAAWRHAQASVAARPRRSGAAVRRRR